METSSAVSAGLFGSDGEPALRRRPRHEHDVPMWEPVSPSSGTVWPFDPLAEALAASAWRDAGAYPAAFCAEVGRRLLLMQLQSSEWILRRVEKINLAGELAVHREVTLEFMVPDIAPVFEDVDATRKWCVPISLMRRRTLIGVDLLDEERHHLTLTGLRMTQQLDQSLILAAALCRHPHLAGDERLDSWIRRAVSGDLPEVREAYDELAARKPPAPLDELREDDLFLNVVDRLRHNFTLYLFLDEQERRTRHLHISFDEPTDWRYQKPRIEASTAPGRADAMTYVVGTPESRIRGSLARLGVLATRIRFQVPGAESAASFHFELAAPPGVQVVKAALLAGRPNDPKRHTSLDEVVGHSPTVGLHSVEVPNGSLCRVQADLRVTARGWLSTMAVVTFALAALLVVVSLHVQREVDRGTWHTVPEIETTNAILLLVSATAAAAALVAQRDFAGVAARFVSGIRTVITASLALPIIAAGILTYGGRPTSVMSDGVALWVMWGLTALSAVICVLTLGSFLLSLRSGRTRLIQESPWDMTRLERDSGEPSARASTRVDDFCDALVANQFDSSAVGVASAEGWHTTYAWTDEKQCDAVDDLEEVHYLTGPSPICGSAPSTCGRDRAKCPGLRGREEQQ